MSIVPFVGDPSAAADRTWIGASWRALLHCALAGIATLTLVACAPRPVQSTVPRFTDDFSSYADGTQYGEGARFGSWLVEFGGFGAVRVTDGSLELVPAQAASTSVTHSALVTGPVLSAPIVFDVRVFTGAQLRVGDLPNPWEAAWIVWAFTDAAHCYYFLPKPNGWELAKRDPAYRGGQRILTTGESPKFRVNRWYDVRVTHRGAEFMVSVDGQEVTRYVDTERPYREGKIALYSEDAAVRFDNVRVF